MRGDGPDRRPRRGLGAGDLAALPLLLFPPALFLAALILELTRASHRVAWALVAVLAGAASLYNLATAMTGTATNLNLSYYILLGGARAHRGAARLLRRPDGLEPQPSSRRYG